MTPIEVEFVARILGIQIPPINSRRILNFLPSFSQTQNLLLMEFEMMALFQILATNDVSKRTISMPKINKYVLKF
jgi:hypothetical protein